MHIYYALHARPSQTTAAYSCTAAVPPVSNLGGSKTTEPAELTDNGQRLLHENLGGIPAARREILRDLGSSLKRSP